MIGSMRLEKCPICPFGPAFNDVSYVKHVETDEHQAYASGLAPLHEIHRALVESAGVTVTQFAVPSQFKDSVVLSLWVPRAVVALLRHMGPSRVDNRAWRIAVIKAAVSERLGPAIYAAVAAGYPKAALEIATAELSPEELETKVRWFAGRITTRSGTDGWSW